MGDLDRFMDLITAGTGVIRTVHPDLEREALERAFEARNQVGLNVHPDDPSLDLILHPTQTDIETRLGEGWDGKGVGELATWNYLFNDPISAAAQGLLDSPVHRKVLDDPTFMYWGAGIYTELPVNASEIGRRWYFIVWLSKGVPVPESVQTFSDVPPTHPFFHDVEWAAANKITAGTGDGKFSPDEPVTRAQMTAFMRRLANLLKL